jgi:hypothetical protein
LLNTGTLDAALDYAARGWPVLPLWWPTSFGPKDGDDRARCACGSQDCRSQAKHPIAAVAPHGLTDATVDVDMIGGWWKRYPRANVGIRTGVAFDALDIDSAGADVELGARAVELDAVTDDDVSGGLGPMVATAAGWHLYYATGRANRTAIVPGVDWRGTGGYVVAPPSMHHAGVAYEWQLGCGPDTPIPPVPVWLAAVYDGGRPTPSPSMRIDTHTLPGRTGSTSTADRRQSYACKALESELGRLVLTPVGGRNDALNRAAHALGQLVGAGLLDLGHVVDSLLAVAAHIGLQEHEAERTIESGLRAGIAQPRKVA